MIKTASRRFIVLNHYREEGKRNRNWFEQPFKPIIEQLSNNYQNNLIHARLFKSSKWKNPYLLTNRNGIMNLKICHIDHLIVILSKQEKWRNKQNKLVFKLYWHGINRPAAFCLSKAVLITNILHAINKA